MFGAAAMASGAVSQAFTGSAVRRAPPLGAIALVVFVQVVGARPRSRARGGSWGGRSRAGESFNAGEVNSAALGTACNAKAGASVD